MKGVLLLCTFLSIPEKNEENAIERRRVSQDHLISQSNQHFSSVQINLLEVRVSSCLPF